VPRQFVIVFAAAVVLASAAPVRAYAQAPGQTESNATNSLTMAAVQPLLRAASDAASAEAPQLVPRPDFTGERSRSLVMPSLYASTAMMQVLDIHSTLAGLERGAVEANPLMSGVTSHRTAFIAAKAGMAVGTILAARQMSKHNKVMAALTLIGVNSVYAAVVSHNYKPARARR
jgi:hypothetical protein